MKQAEVLHFLSVCSNRNLDNSHVQSELDKPTFNWFSVLGHVGDLLVTPALYVDLEHRGLLGTIEDEAAHYLSTIYAANLARNQAILAEFYTLTRNLNDAGVLPVPIKGIGLLLSGIYANIGERVMIDIDLLISADEIEATVVSLVKAGYQQPLNDYLIDDRDHRNEPGFIQSHLPPFFKEQAIARVDVHVSVTHTQDPQHQAFIDQIYSSAKTIEQEGVKLKVASPISNILVNTYHSQKKDRHFTRGLYDLRHLRDLKLSLDQCKPEDLVELQQQADQLSLGKYLKYFLMQLKETNQLSETLGDVTLTEKLRFSVFKLHNRSSAMLVVSRTINEVYRYLNYTFSLSKLRTQFGPRPYLELYRQKLLHITHNNRLKRALMSIFNVKR